MILKEKLSETMQIFLFGMLDYSKLSEQVLVEFSSHPIVVKHYSDRVVQALVKVLKTQRSRSPSPMLAQ